MRASKADAPAPGFSSCEQVAKLGPVSRAAGMDCEYSLEQNFTPGDGTNDEEDLWQNNM